MTLFSSDAVESSAIVTNCEVPDNTMHIFDGMVLLQQLTSTSLLTFGNVSERF